MVLLTSILIALVAVGIPVGTDVVVGDNIDSNSNVALQGLERLGEKIQFKSREKQIDERIQELRKAQNNKAIARGIKNLDNTIGTELDNAALNKRTEVLTEIREQLTNERAKEAINLALIAPIIKGNFELSEKLNTTPSQALEHVQNISQKNNVMRLDIDEKIQRILKNG